jgi:opacity protein-like surface antigen
MKILQRLLVLFGFGLISSAALAQGVRQDPNAFSGWGLGVTSGLSRGAHLVGVEVVGQSAILASDGLDGPSAGITLQYLESWDKWRFGPRMHLEKTNYTAADRIGNPNASLETSLKLDKLHSFTFAVGRVVNKWMPYAFLGVAFSNGTIGAKLNITDQFVEASSKGWVAGPILGFGLERQIEKDFYLGLEYSQARFNKSFDECSKELGGCVKFPVKIEPKMLKVTLTKRF